MGRGDLRGAGWGNRRTAGAAWCAALAVALAALFLPAGALGAQPGVVLPNPGDGATQAQIVSSGARHVRVFASWRALEPERRRLSPAIIAGYDSLADRMKAAGISLSFVVTETPAWATPSQAPNAAPPAGAYGDFMRRLAAHFRGRVSAYEVWNEPNDPAFWSGKATPGEYAPLLRAAYDGVKSADSAARVGVGGLLGNDHDFVDGLYAAGAQGTFDFVGVHTDLACETKSPRSAIREPTGRVSRWSFTGYREVRAVMLAHGDDKPIWMTELGWSVTRRRCGGRRGGVTARRQAALLKRAYACLAADPYVERASWFSLADFGTDDRVGLRYGLFDWRGRARPALRAFQRAAAAKPDPRCGIQVDRSGAAIKIARP